MADDERWSNDWARGKYYGESYEESRWRREEESRERQRLDELDRSSKGGDSSGGAYYGGSSETSSEPVQLSKTALYLGIPLLILAFLIWHDYLPFNDVKLFGLPLARVLFFTGLLCVAFKYMVKIAGILLIGAGAIGMLGTVMAILSGVAISSVIPNLALSGGAIGIGLLIIRASLSRK